MARVGRVPVRLADSSSSLSLPQVSAEGKGDVVTFGTTHLADHRELEGGAGSKWATLLHGILEHLVRLRTGLLAIKKAMAELEAAGMWPGVPVELWEGRENTGYKEKCYLRLSFPKGALGGGRRKLYIGRDKEKIRVAREKAARRRQWEGLEKERVRLERFLRMTRSGLEREAGSVQRYQIPDDLGLELAGQEASAGPNELPVESSPEWIRTRRREVKYELDGEPEYTEMVRHEPEFKSGEVDREKDRD